MISSKSSLRSWWRCLRLGHDRSTASPSFNRNETCQRLRQRSPTLPPTERAPSPKTGHGLVQTGKIVDLLERSRLMMTYAATRTKALLNAHGGDERGVVVNTLRCPRNSAMHNEVAAMEDHVNCDQPAVRTTSARAVAMPLPRLDRLAKAGVRPAGCGAAPRRLPALALWRAVPSCRAE
jgi:hypothetical protein